jgi:His-Xaa-Ser system radical SAM maturase HxsB
MSLTHLDLAIEHMLKSPAPHVTMEFQGGETLLAFDSVKYGVLAAKEKASLVGKKITFVICTNLSLIDEEKLDFIHEHNILVSTSLDGPSTVHDNNRHVKDHSSYDKTIKGISLARKRIGADNVSALMTTTDITLQYPVEIVDEYFNQGFRNIFLRPISPYGFAVRSKSKNKYDMERFMEFYKKALDRILWYNKKGHFFAESFSCIFLKKILTPFPVGFVDIMSPMGGIVKAVVFNYDGYVYSSDESRMLAEMNDFTFRIGHLDHDDYNELFYGDKSYDLVEESIIESQPGCVDCALVPYCGSDPVYNHATQGRFWGYKPQSGYCQRNMGIINHLFELMEDPDNMRVFEKWISIR